MILIGVNFFISQNCLEDYKEPFTLQSIQNIYNIEKLPFRCLLKRTFQEKHPRWIL